MKKDNDFSDAAKKYRHLMTHSSSAKAVRKENSSWRYPWKDSSDYSSVRVY